MDDKIKREKQQAAAAAVKMVEDGMTLGLGTGSTAYFAIEGVGALVRDGCRLRCVSTSSSTEEQASSLGVELVSIDEVDEIDLTIDGTDEFDARLNLIKGGGGALLKEKMVARLTRKQVIIADSTKSVEKLGAFRIPVEVLPFAVNYAADMIKEISGTPHIRMTGGGHFVTDEKNFIIDADFGLMDDPYGISDELNNIEGVVCNGLFLDLADVVIVGEGESVSCFYRD